MNAPRTTLHVWRVPARRLPIVLCRLARDRGQLRRTPGVRFAKILGTGKGQAFGPTQADLGRWATLVVWDPAHPAADLNQTAVGQKWCQLASSYCRFELVTLASRGTWAGRDPFTQDPDGRPKGSDGPPKAYDGAVLAITRARLRPTRALTFWRAIDTVAPAARQADGLLATFGIGEAPIGWQGTVSLWRSARDLVEFAYRHPDHRKAIEQTQTRRWYAEELFARFAVHEVTGDPTVIGWDDPALGQEEPGAGHEQKERQEDQ